MSKQGQSLLAVFGFAFVIVLHGAIPWISLPTLGQAVWSMGFAASFADGPLSTIHARHFGIPAPASISFGLVGVYTASVFIRLGFHPADAYSATMLLWLGVAYVGAARLAQFLGVGTPVSWLMGVLWLSLPIVWGHSGYSFLLLGIALLPFYFLAAFRLLPLASDWKEVKGGRPGRVLLYVSVCLVAVFMDGYTFVMFAVGVTLIWAVMLVTRAEDRRYLVGAFLPVHLASLMGVYLLYTAYVGTWEFTPSRMDVFRGWGADVLYWMAPTQGMHWLWDVVGLSVERTHESHFGDFSIWTTTFILPLILAAIWAWRRASASGQLIAGLAVIVLFAFYMALGPSLKVGTVKPEPMGHAMPVELGVTRTGSEVILANVPGFKNMRAVYRWTALGAFGLWSLFALGLSGLQRSGEQMRGAAAILVLMIALMPNLGEKWERDRQSRHSFLLIDRDLLEPLGEDVSEGEVIAFLPYGNDFIANYLAPSLGIRTYNIGGDKNLFMARKNWPSTMSGFQVRRVDADFWYRIMLLLARVEADAIILPHFQFLRFDPFRGVYVWPPKAGRYEYDWELLNELQLKRIVQLRHREYYSVLRLSTELQTEVGKEPLEARLIAEICPIEYPIRFEDKECLWMFTLGDGWHGYEARHIWSTADAELVLYPPSQCEARDCGIRLQLLPFAASPDRPVKVEFELTENGRVTRHERIFADAGQKEVAFGVGPGGGRYDLRIRVPDAAAPADLRDSPDTRVLGVALFELDIAPRVAQEKWH